MRLLYSLITCLLITITVTAKNVNYDTAVMQKITDTTYASGEFSSETENSSVASTYGYLQTFNTLTLPPPPTVTTSAATIVTASTATLNGSGNPNGDATTGWFRYSTTNPGTGNDVFGTRAPATSGISLGSGSSAVNFSRAITGLTANTTYYYCAIAQNVLGTSFGTIQTFTTAAPPVATTNAATSVTISTATLNGNGIPNRAATTAWFRYSTTNPGVGNDVFGTRAPSSGGTSLGSGSSSVNFSEAITGLASATIYYYCAIAQNAEGISFGTIQTFTTASPPPPTVTTSAATSVTASAAALNGSGNPNGSSTTGWFRYSTVSPGTPNDSYGTRVPASGGTSLGSGSSAVSFSEAITGLAASTTYYYSAIAQNGSGTSFGALQTFTTAPPPPPPTVTTNAATSVTSSTALLNGNGNPNGSATTGWYRYSTTSPGTPNDSYGTRVPASGGTSLGSGSSAVSFSEAITGLAASTTYYYSAIAQNGSGTSFGALQTFTTAAPPPPPTVTTNAATSVTSSTALLNGNGNPNGSATTGWYRYSTTSPGTPNDSYGTRVPASGGTALGSGSSAVSFSEAITGLAASTTYYYSAIAQNGSGTSFGALQIFTTAAPPPPPTVTTNAATSVTSSTALLNGNGNPNGSATTGWYRYSTTSPGTPNDSYGTRVPASGGTALGSGSSAVSFSEAITGLAASTTYYYSAIAQNASGTSFGALQTFTTVALPPPPTVTTSAATSVTASAAALNGSGNPNGLATTGWFRYSTVSPGTPNDSYGTRVPASGGTSLGSGSSAVSFSEAITGLGPSTTYYYSAIAQNASGTSFGSLVQFTTSALPPSNVGIGTIDPQTKLHIIGGTALDLTDNSGYLAIGAVDAGNLVLDNNQIQARNNGAAANLYLQTEGGQVVLGSGGASHKLTVNGNAFKSNGTSAWEIPSDSRLKKDINPYTDGLASILKINPVWFRYNEVSGFDMKQKNVGILAQELQKISPYMVSKLPVKKAPDGSSYLQVDNGAMTYMLINAVKELQQINEALKKRIEALEGKQ